MGSPFYSLEDLEIGFCAAPKRRMMYHCANDEERRGAATRSNSVRSEPGEEKPRNFSRKYQELLHARTVLRGKATERLNGGASKVKKKTSPPDKGVAWTNHQSSDDTTLAISDATSAYSLIGNPDRSKRHQDQVPLTRDLTPALVLCGINQKENSLLRSPSCDDANLRYNAVKCIQSAFRQYLSNKMATEKKAALVISSLAKAFQVEQQTRMAHVNTVLRGIARRKAECLMFRRRELYTIHEAFADTTEEESKADCPW